MIAKQNSSPARRAAKKAWLPDEKGVMSKNTKMNLCLSPENSAKKARLRRLASSFMASKKIAPPLSYDEIASLTKDFMREFSLPERLAKFCSILLSNEVWKPILSSIPYERRVMLIPQCLRREDICKAEIDALGLICKKCGACQIGGIQSLAETLGYVVIVAEGTTLVSKLLESGKVDGVVGIGCISVLEKIFECISAHAIPGLAVPLNRDGCARTSVDMDWVYETIRLRDRSRRLSFPDVEELKDEVRKIFCVNEISRICGTSGNVEKIALKYVCKGGKRWRPLLAAGAYMAEIGASHGIPEATKKIIVAVELFHKASLIHDDIEDEDDFRDGAPSLHKMVGTASALNLGDILIGMGYRLITGADQIPVESRLKMLEIASSAHVNLCKGQGEELLLMSSSKMPSSESLLQIFRLKTSPAFEVALTLGALCAQCDAKTIAVLKNFSQPLGIAYQIKDDMEDFSFSKAKIQTRAQNSIVISLIEKYARNSSGKITISNRRTYDECRVSAERYALKKSRQLCEYYRNEALRALTPLEKSSLKAFLRKVMTRIL